MLGFGVAWLNHDVVFPAFRAGLINLSRTSLLSSGLGNEVISYVGKLR